MAVEVVTAEIGELAISFETGRLAKQANGAVVVRAGDSMVLVTAVGLRDAREGVDFFPLTVDVEERMYAAGKIPGGFIKRESRPSDRATLTARMTDRPIRPLWPKGYRNETQVVATVLSTDQVNAFDILCINGASAALMISDLPFQGPDRGGAHRPDRRRVRHQPDAPGDGRVRPGPRSSRAARTPSRWSSPAPRRSTRRRSSRRSRSPTTRSRSSAPRRRSSARRPGRRSGRSSPSRSTPTCSPRSSPPAARRSRRRRSSSASWSAATR